MTASSANAASHAVATTVAGGTRQGSASRVESAVGPLAVTPLATTARVHYPDQGALGIETTIREPPPVVRMPVSTWSAISSEAAMACAATSAT